MRSHRPLFLSTLLALLPTTGCSFVTVRPPPHGPIDPHAEVACTASPAAPVLDTLAGTGVAAVTLVAWFLDNLFSSRSHVSDEVAGGALVAASLYASALYGADRTQDCRGLLEWVERCKKGDGTACTALGVPAVPNGAPATP